MKIYSVKPSSPTIRVSDGRELTADGEIAWGDGGAGATYLCRAILADVFGDVALAIKYAQRLKYRTVAKWDAKAPRAITEEEVRGHFADMKRTEIDYGPMVERMSREKPQFINDRPDPGQEYSSNPGIKPNFLKEKS